MKHEQEPESRPEKDIAGSYHSCWKAGGKVVPWYGGAARNAACRATPSEGTAPPMRFPAPKARDVSTWNIFCMLNYLSNHYLPIKAEGITCLYKNNLEVYFSWVSLARIIAIIRNRAGKKCKELLSPSFFPKQTQPSIHTSCQMSPHVFKGLQWWVRMMVHRKSIPFFF